MAAATSGHPSTGPFPPGLDTPLTRDFPAVAQLPRAELEQLLHGDPSQGPAEQDAFFEAYVQTLPQVRHMSEEHQKLLASVEEKAQRNAALQPRLEALRRETQQYFDSSRSLEAEWGPLQAALSEIYKRFSPGSLHSALTQGTHKIHDASEALAIAYVEGMPSLASGVVTPEDGNGADAAAKPAAAGLRSQDPDTHFVRKFRELRTRYHRRSLFAERWSKGTVDWRDE